MKAADLSSLPPGSTQALAIAGLLRGMRRSLPLRNYVRVMGTKYATAPPTAGVPPQLSMSNGPSRFSPLNAGQPSASAAFTVLYGAADLATASYEGMIRDSLDLDPTRDVGSSDYGPRCAVNVSTAPGVSIEVLDLTRGNAVRHGLPTDVLRYSKHTDGQHFSEFVHRELPWVDGILYASRFTEVLCVAIYDRAVGKLVHGPRPVPLSRSLLTPTLAPWRIRVL